MGIRTKSNIKLVSGKKSKEVPQVIASDVESLAGDENTRLFKDFGFPITNLDDVFIPGFDPDAVEWEYGGTFFPINKDKHPDTFEMLANIYALPKEKLQSKKIGNFTFIADFEDEVIPIFTIENNKGKALASFEITTDEDDDILNVGIAWGPELRNSSKKKRRDYIVNCNRLITWVFSQCRLGK